MIPITLINKQQAGDDMFVFTFEKPRLKWRGGQHSMVFVDHAGPDDRGITRPLSIATSCHEDKLMMVTHCPAEASTFKRALRDLPIGATVSITQPDGSFVYEESDEPALFVAGGVGIAAIRAMLMDLDLEHKPLKGRLLYYTGVRPALFADELDALTQKHQDFSVQYLDLPDVVEEQGGVQDVETGVRGRVYFSAVYSQRLLQFDNFQSHVEELQGQSEDHRREARLLMHVRKLLK